MIGFAKEQPGSGLAYRKRFATVGLVVFASSLVGGCLYDDGDRCGENQVFRDDACFCDDASALIDFQCIPCSDNEVPVEGGCECKDGYIREATGKCVEDIPGMGDTCSSDDDCPDEGATACLSDDGADTGVCTSTDCEDNLDCPRGFGCELNADPTLCIPPPTGFEDPCESNADCTGEAAYCETLQGNICMFECKADPGSCHGDWVCCDYGNLGLSAICVPPDELEDGSCPLGGTMLEAME